MIYFITAISILIVLAVVLTALFSVAYVTVAERKTMASMQRRLGPNIVGFWGLLQAFADALKLLIKEYVSPAQANLILFFLGPIITLVYSLLGYGVIPYGPGLTIWDFDLGILYMLAVSSLATYGILLAGWSANSKYAFLGSLRSTAQLISYELILSSAILLVVLLTASLNLTINIEYQRAVWFAIPLLPIFIIFFIGSVAETNRAPFDLAEAESELVSGFMTEHAAVIFVFFFLAEYGSIVLICILNSILFLGGYLYNYISYPIEYISSIDWLNLEQTISIIFPDLSNSPLREGLQYGITLGIKSSIMIFTFIWVRASFPRIRFDQLMIYSWTILLPIIIAFIILIPCIIYIIDCIPLNISILFFLPFKHNKKNKDITEIDITKENRNKKIKSFVLMALASTILMFIFRYSLNTLWELDLLDIKKDLPTKVSVLFIFNCCRLIIKECIDSHLGLHPLNGPNLPSNNLENKTPIKQYCAMDNNSNGNNGNNTGTNGTGNGNTGRNTMYTPGPPSENYSISDSPDITPQEREWLKYVFLGEPIAKRIDPTTGRLVVVYRSNIYQSASHNFLTMSGTNTYYIDENGRKVENRSFSDISLVRARLISYNSDPHALHAADAMNNPGREYAMLHQARVARAVMTSALERAAERAGENGRSS